MLKWKVLVFLNINDKRRIGILFQDFSRDWKKLFNFEGEGQEFSKILSSLEQIIQTVFRLVPGCFIRINILEQFIIQIGKK